MPSLFNKFCIHNPCAIRFISTHLSSEFLFLPHLQPILTGMLIWKQKIEHQDFQNKLVVGWQSQIFIYTSVSILLASNPFLYLYLEITTKHLDAPVQHQGEHLHASTDAAGKPYQRKCAFKTFPFQSRNQWRCIKFLPEIFWHSTWPLRRPQAEDETTGRRTRNFCQSSKYFKLLQCNCKLVKMLKSTI